jgi:hypothetical protein
VRVLLADPGEEAPHLGLVAEALQAVELALQAGVVEQDVDLPVTGRADLCPGAEPAFVFFGDQMMDGEALDLPLAELARHGEYNAEDRAS